MLFNEFFNLQGVRTMTRKRIVFILVFIILSYRVINANDWMKLFRDANSRLTTNPEDSNFRLDPGIVGEWKCQDIISNNEYGILIKSFRFNGNATGVVDFNYYILYDDQKLYLQSNKSKSYSFYWGIVVEYTDNNEPVTMLKLQFSDGSYLWYYYGKFSNSNICLIQYNDKTGKPGDATNLRTNTVFDKDWNSNYDEICKVIWNHYQKSQAIDKQKISNYGTNSMLFQNLRMSAGSWF